MSNRNQFVQFISKYRWPLGVAMLAQIFVVLTELVPSLNVPTDFVLFGLMGTILYFWIAETIIHSKSKK